MITSPNGSILCSHSITFHVQETDYAGRSWIENKAQSLSKKRWRFALGDVTSKYQLRDASLVPSSLFCCYVFIFPQPDMGVPETMFSAKIESHQ